MFIVTKYKIIDGQLQVTYTGNTRTFTKPNICDVPEYKEYNKQLLEANFKFKYTISIPTGYYVDASKLIINKEQL